MKRLSAAFPPFQNPQSPESIPSAGTSDFLHLEKQFSCVPFFQLPESVCSPFTDQQFQSIVHSLVIGDTFRGNVLFFSHMFNTAAFLSYALVVTFTPGPNNLMSMFNAGRDGYGKTLRFLLGIMTGFFIIMMLSGYFNLLLASYLPRFMSFMRIVGMAYMLFLAWKVSGIGSGKRVEKREKKSGIVNRYTVGMMMQLVNVKVILYGLTILSGFVLPYYPKSWQLALFSLLLAFMSFTSINCWALFGSLFNRFIQRYEKPFNYAMSALLVYSALAIAGIAG